MSLNYMCDRNERTTLKNRLAGLSLIPKISVLLALEHISFLLVFYFVRFKLYTRFDMCSYFFAKI